MQFDCLRRREFIALFGGAAAAWPIATHAQPSTVPVLGFLDPGAPEIMARRLAAFRQGLSETGFTEGRNLAIEYRWARGDPDRLPELAADLVRLRVAAIFAFTVTAAVSAKAATTTIPIVYLGAGDPVALGLVSSLNRPGGNITGLSNIGTGLELKRFGILQEMRPGAKRFAVLIDPRAPTAQSIAGDVRAAAASRGLQIEVLSVTTARDVDIAFATLVQKQVAGLLVPPQPSFGTRRVQLVTLAARHAVPAIYSERESVDAGGLMTGASSGFPAARLSGGSRFRYPGMCSLGLGKRMHFHQWKRREFITLLGGAAAAWPLTARAQQKAMPVVGYLSSLGQAVSVQFDAAFRRGLSQMGYVEGQNVSVEYRWISDSYDQLPAMAADLVQRQVAVICALGPPAVLAAKAATTNIPIVFVTGADPIKFGFVASFNQPGGTITGIWIVSTVLAAKRLQLMRELLPKAKLIALLVNPKSPVAEPQTRDAQAAAQALGLKLTVLNAVSESELDQDFAALVRQRADALFVSADPIFYTQREHLVALAARHSIPTLYEIREYVEVGGLMSYGTVFREGYHKGGIYVGRILKGVKPAELPVEQINKLELVLNGKTAKTLGLEIPPTLLALADEVIE